VQILASPSRDKQERQLTLLLSMPSGTGRWPFSTLTVDAELLENWRKQGRTRKPNLALCRGKG